MYLVGFIIIICHDEQSLECQILSEIFAHYQICLHALMLYLLSDRLEGKLHFSQFTDILTETNKISVFLSKFLMPSVIKNTKTVDQNLMCPIQLQTVLDFGFRKVVHYFPK